MFSHRSIYVEHFLAYVLICVRKLATNSSSAFMADPLFMLLSMYMYALSEPTFLWFKVMEFVSFLLNPNFYASFNLHYFFLDVNYCIL